MCVSLSHVQEHTRVGSADSQDIQLCGMAIQTEHCVIDITEHNNVVLTPHVNARYVEGKKKKKLNLEQLGGQTTCVFLVKITT